MVHILTSKIPPHYVQHTCQQDLYTTNSSLWLSGYFNSMFYIPATRIPAFHVLHSYFIEIFKYLDVLICLLQDNLFKIAMCSLIFSPNLPLKVTKCVCVVSIKGIVSLSISSREKLQNILEHAIVLKIVDKFEAQCSYKLCFYKNCVGQNIPLISELYHPKYKSVFHGFDFKLLLRTLLIFLYILSVFFFSFSYGSGSKDNNIYCYIRGNDDYLVLFFR